MLKKKYKNNFDTVNNTDKSIIKSKSREKMLNLQKLISLYLVYELRTVHYISL